MLRAAICETLGQQWWLMKTSVASLTGVVSVQRVTTESIRLSKLDHGSSLWEKTSSIV
jgi:hypothetical protein